jgi:hypothetical protein
MSYAFNTTIGTFDDRFIFAFTEQAPLSICGSGRVNFCINYKQLQINSSQRIDIDRGYNIQFSWTKYIKKNEINDI